MLSNTFQIVSDNAKNVAAMQRAETILAVEDAMSAEQLNELHSQVGFRRAEPPVQTHSSIWQHQLDEASSEEGYMTQAYDDPDEPDGDGLSSLR
jgi:hypothetical protein